MTTAPALAAILDAAQWPSTRPPKYGFSDACDCARKQVYAFRDSAPEGDAEPASVKTPARWNMAMRLGTAVGEWLEEIARGLGYETQVPVSLPNEHGLEIIGTADVVGDTFVADFKLCGDSSWKDARAAAKPAHRIQVHTYAFALGKPTAALWYLRNKPSGEQIEHIIHEEPTDPACAQAVIAHWLSIDTHRQLGTLPERPYEEPHPVVCRTCTYREECWT